MRATKSFVCRPEAATYVSDDFKIYACEVREDMYPDIKPNIYGSVTIKGAFGELTTGADYEVTAVEMFDPRYKYSYLVQFIQPKKLEDVSRRDNIRKESGKPSESLSGYNRADSRGQTGGSEPREGHKAENF